MSVDEISPMAKFHAERILKGEGVSDTEMRIVTAGLMLSVDELTHVVRGLTSQLWTDAQLRKLMREEVVIWSAADLRSIIRSEVEKHCAGKKHCAALTSEEPKSANWVGTMLRRLGGLKCLFLGLFASFALMFCGCASYAVRFDDGKEPSPRPYPATRLDWSTAGFLADEFGAGGCVIALPLLLDLPLSLATDTACLPYDLLTNWFPAWCRD